jgi:hypothetical protein
LEEQIKKESIKGKYDKNKQDKGKHNNGKSGTLKKASVICFLLAFIALGVYSAINMKSYFIYKETKQLEDLDIVYNNIFVKGEMVGGLTLEQANTITDEIVNGGYASDKELTFRLAGSGYEKSFTYPELGMGFDTQKGVDEAYAVGRTGNKKADRATIAELDMGGKYYDAETSYSIDAVKECLSTIEPEVNDLLSSEGTVMDVDRTAAAAEQMLMINEYGVTIIIATK